jgi:hypothetical protein
MYYIAIYYNDEFFGFVNSYNMRNIKISQHLSDVPKYDIIEKAKAVKLDIEIDFKIYKPLSDEFVTICIERFDNFNPENFKFMIKNLYQERKNKILDILDKL